MISPAENLLEILRLERIERNIFRGANEDRMGGRLFGGQVLGQALRAAWNTVEGRFAHSLHGYFIRPGDSSRPVLYDVERIRDGTSFATRRVVAIQNGAAICNLDVSFQVDEEGFSHEDAMPNVPLPEDLEDDVASVRRLADADPRGHRWARRERPFESRSVYGMGRERASRERFWNPVWLRFKSRVAASDRALSCCLLAYASDMGMVSTSILPHTSVTHALRFAPGAVAARQDDTSRARVQMASLDHALWIHRRFVIDDWLLFVKRSSTATGSRGMNHAEFFDRSGQLVASVAQEGLMRMVE